MSAIRIALAFAVALALVACGDASTPTATLMPTPTSTATPTPSPTPTPIPTSDTHRAAVSFGEGTPIGDAELLALLVKHNLKGRWAHTEVHEYSGSSQAAEPTDPRAFVSTIREEMVNSFSPVLKDDGVTSEARRLANEYTPNDLRTSDDARADAVDFIRWSNAIAQARDYVNNGGPVVYSVIVVGKEDDLRRLGAEERVQDFNIATIDQPWFVWPPFATPTPTPSGVGGQSDAPTATPTATPLPPQALYDQILALAARDLPGQPPFQTPTPTPTAAP